MTLTTAHNWALNRGRRSLPWFSSIRSGETYWLVIRGDKAAAEHSARAYGFAPQATAWKCGPETTLEISVPDFDAVRRLKAWLHSTEANQVRDGSIVFLSPKRRAFLSAPPKPKKPQPQCTLEIL